MKQKASHVIENIKRILTIHENNLKQLEIQAAKEKKTDKEVFTIVTREIHRASEQFSAEAKIDAFTVLDELRLRTPPAVRDRIVTVLPHLKPADNPDADVTFHRLLAFSPFSIGFVQQLADEIEELSRLLPDK